MSSHQVQDRDTGASDPGYVKLRSKDLMWYIEDIEGQLSPELRAQFETYSGLAPKEVLPHISAIRTKLWDLRAYPCTGVSMFLVPWIKYHSALPAILTALTPSSSNPHPKLLDVGCYVGHDLRALHFAGISQSALYGMDILPFWDLGFELFCDKDKFSIKTVLGDILDFSPTHPQAELLDGKMKVVWCSAVIHQFSWSQQLLACTRLLQFTSGTGSLILGAGVGSMGEEGSLDMQKLTEGKFNTEGPFKHTAGSMERLWREVGEAAGVILEVETSWGTWVQWGSQEGRCDFMGKDMGVIEFTVRVV